MAQGRLNLQQKLVRGLFPEGKGRRFLELIILLLSCADCLEIWESEPPGNLRAYPGLYRVCFTFTVT
jgi:hypothetical protein